MGCRSALSRSVFEPRIVSFLVTFRTFNAAHHRATFYLGFLDGGDRTMALTSDHAYSAPSGSESASDLCLYGKLSARTCSTAFSDTGGSHLSTGNTTAALLVTNLPPLLFSQISDLEPLLYPYGAIRHVQFLDSSSGLISNLGSKLNTDRDTKGSQNLEPDTKATLTSVIVEYANPTSAQEAKLCLHGQVYAGFRLEVEYACRYSSVPASSVASLSGRPNKNMIENMDGNCNFSYMSLNPLAPPFVLESYSSQQDFILVAANLGAVSGDEMHSFSPSLYNQPLDTRSSGHFADIRAQPGARFQYWLSRNGHQQGCGQQNSIPALPNHPVGYDLNSTPSTSTVQKSGFANLKFVHSFSSVVLCLIEICSRGADFQHQFRDPLDHAMYSVTNSG